MATKKDTAREMGREMEMALGREIERGGDGDS